MGITYQDTKLGNTIAVNLDGKKVGFIRHKENGYTYFPATTPRNGGESYPTLDACKRSIEGDLGYEDILDRDVPAIRTHAQEWARQGVTGHIRIYYKHRAIAGRLTACNCCDTDLDAEGWKYSGVWIPSNVPYERYWSYLYQRLMNVPLFA